MVYPNTSAQAFSNWLLNTSWQKLTPSLKALITVINTASNSGASVTNQQWINFVQATSWRQKYYDSWALNNTPYSVNPIGTCDFWLSSQYLALNSTNFSGQTRFNNQVQLIKDLLGGAVTGANANLLREPYPVLDGTRKQAKQFFAFNTGALQFFNLTNAGALVQNKGSYSMFMVANVGAVASFPVAFYFSSGANVAKMRFGLQVSSAGNWQGTATRLDADAQATLNGSPASSAYQIICFTLDYTTGKGVIYSNGVQVGLNNTMVTAGTTSNVASSQVSIGTLNAGQIWTGLISDVLGFQTALSPANVLTITNWLNGLRSVF